MTDNFYLPESFYMEHGLRDLVPTVHPQAAYIVTSVREAQDLSQMTRGRADKPNRDVVVYGPTGVPVAIVAAGVTETAELEDLAIGVYEKHEAKRRRGEPIIDFEAFRARHGYAAKKDFDQAWRQALVDRIHRHRRNPISDPAPVRCDQPKGNVYGT